ncbi:hypothetical protein DP43_2254 [Burkholderia pseudomallei]|nr:hypothetical protein DP43_2254 [Burkholderia pseudomallei]
MLLPLSTEKGRSLSLDHHMALAVVRSGSGDCDQGVCLCYELSISRSLCEARLHRVSDLNLYQQAEAGDAWTLLEGEVADVGACCSCTTSNS